MPLLRELLRHSKRDCLQACQTLGIRVYSNELPTWSLSWWNQQEGGISRNSRLFPWGLALNVLSQCSEQWIWGLYPLRGGQCLHIQTSEIYLWKNCGRDSYVACLTIEDLEK